MQICRQIWLLEKQQNSHQPLVDILLQTLWMATGTIPFKGIVALTQWDREDLGGRLTWTPFTKSDRWSSKAEATVVVSSYMVL